MRAAQLYREEEMTERSGDAEFSLGLGSLLAIFFGLAIVCGIFFGFGYKIGHRPQAAQVAAETVTQSEQHGVALVSPKPSAQSLEHPEDANQVVTPIVPSVHESGAVRPSSAVAIRSSSAQAVASPQTAMSGRTVAPLLLPAKTAVPPGANIMVQIAAVKSSADADALAAALRKNGFTPSIRSETQDKLMHVQVGPFATREEAKVMRQQLVSAGYNAFIK